MYSTANTIVDFFLAQSQKTPNRIAIQFEGKILTYKELDEESNRFANYILSIQDIQQEDIIGVQLQRSEKYIIVLLAIFKINACCAPIDVKIPQERLQAIQDNFTTIIRQKHVDAFLEKRATLSTVYAAEKRSQLAYIVYTSGSTGIPKGCMLEHKGILNHIQSKIALLELNENSKLCHTSKFYFVGSLWQLWAPLFVGGTVILTTLEELQDISLLLDKTIDNDVKILEVIPSQLNNVFATGQESKLTHLEKLILTGERLTPNYVNKFFDLNSSIEIINTYGQSECSDVTTYFRMREKIAQGKVLVGKPTKNTSIFICDEHGNLCNIGETGEICTSGVQVCRGYLKQPELTAKTFVENPFDKNSKLYKTGDLGRWSDDGNIEILGRKDNQVKIRGYRIDLGEIENALLHHNDIENVVVQTAKNEEAEEEVVVAYFKSKSSQKNNELRNFLATYLSEYMIPAIFIQVDEFKLTPNGKIDKNILPNPFENQIDSGIDYIAPTDKISKTVAQIWEKTLKKESLGMNDDFVALGGHSLKMNLLIIRYKKAFGVQFSLGELFENTSLASHVALIKSKDQQTATIIPKIPEATSYQLSAAQHKLYFLSELDNETITYDAIFLEDIEPIDNIHAFKTAVASVIQRHEILRTVFKKNEKGDIAQFINKELSDEYNLQVIDYSERVTAFYDMNTYIKNYLKKSFDFENGPLLRTCLFKLPNNRNKFYFRMHQIISDVHSLKVFYSDVMKTYKALKAKNKPSLPTLNIQYKEYAAWQSSQRYQDEFAKSRSFWMQQLAGQLPLIDLPSTKTRPSVKTYNGKLLKLRINTALSNALQTFCEQQNGSTFIGVLSIINILFQKHTAQKDIILATRSLGRYRPELEFQIGNYLNTIVLRNNINEADSFKEIFEKIKKNTLTSFDHQNYYFDWLIEDLDVSISSNRNPIYDIMLTYEDRDNEILNLTGDLIIDKVINEGISVPKLDILFTAERYKDFLQLELQFNTDVYDEKSMTNLLKDFQRLLIKLLENPTTAVSKVDIKEQVKTALKSKNLSRLKSFKV